MQFLSDRTVVFKADSENMAVKTGFFLLVFFKHSMTEDRHCLSQTLVITALLSHLKVWALGHILHPHMEYLVILRLAMDVTFFNFYTK